MRILVVDVLVVIMAVEAVICNHLIIFTLMQYYPVGYLLYLRSGWMDKIHNGRMNGDKKEKLKNSTADNASSRIGVDNGWMLSN